MQIDIRYDRYQKNDTNAENAISQKPFSLTVSFVKCNYFMFFSFLKGDLKMSQERKLPEKKTGMLDVGKDKNHSRATTASNDCI